MPWDAGGVPRELAKYLAGAAGGGRVLIPGCGAAYEVAAFHEAGYEVIAIDEFGYLPLAEVGAEFLFQVIADRTERAAIILTTNLPFSEWTQMFGNARLCKALVDRVTDRSHIIETGRESYRFRRTAESRQKNKKPEGGKGK